MQCRMEPAAVERGPSSSDTCRGRKCRIPARLPTLPVLLRPLPCLAGVAPLRDLLLDCLWQAFVGPVLFWPLIQEDVAAQHIAALTLGGGNGGSAGSAGALAAAAGSASGGRALPEANAAGAGRTVQRGAVGPLCSLYVFERLFRAVTDQQLLTELVSALLGGTAACIGSSGGDSGGASRPGSPERQHRQQAASAAAAAAAPRWQISQALLARLQYSPAAYRQALLSMLRGSDAQVAAAAVRVLAALLQSRAVSEEELELIGERRVGGSAVPARLQCRCSLQCAAACLICVSLAAFTALIGFCACHVTCCSDTCYALATCASCRSAAAATPQAAAAAAGASGGQQPAEQPGDGACCCWSGLVAAAGRPLQAGACTSGAAAGAAAGGLAGRRHRQRAGLQWQLEQEE